MGVQAGLSHHENTKDAENNIMSGISVYKKENVAWEWR